jgi:hypothetical protein
MKTEHILPAVMISVAAMTSSASATEAPNPVASNTTITDRIVPAVLFTDAKPEYKTSDRLLKYEQALMKATGYPVARRLDRCETVSGSHKGWDDSKQDCK